jgi:allophanate hydrolase
LTVFIRSEQIRAREGFIGVHQFGKFVQNVPSPFSIGTVHLERGQQVKGFLCEGIAANGATDITEFGG